MKGIGGNVTGAIQISTTTKNAIGESVKSWATVQNLTGWLDLSSGDSKYTNFNAKVQESTHVFVSDYVKFDSSIKTENSRMVIDSHIYDILVIDNPMEMKSGSQLEIYLKYTGGAANG